MLAQIEAHVSQSGLTVDDLMAREAGGPELAAVGVSTNQRLEGYVIPYFTLQGKPTSFYRIRFLNTEPKYRQPKATPNHIYFPPLFQKAVQNRHYVIITEGERKAACATKFGFPCVGLGGVDSWKSNSLFLPKDTQLTKTNHGKSIQAKLPSGTEIKVETTLGAVGLQELIDLVIERGLKVVIAFDSDDSGSLKFEVQRAAWSLGNELRRRGVPTQNIKILVLPSNGSGKVGLDDYIIDVGQESFKKLLESTLESREAYPRHPNPKEFVNAKLNSGGNKRKDIIDLASTIIAELDSRGTRMKTASSGQPYFFDQKTKSLLPAVMLNKNQGPFHESDFGQFLYKEFGISGADAKLISWLAAQFTGEDPVEIVEPARVLAQVGDGSIAHQISDSEMAIISAEGITFHHNGYKGILFEHNQVDPVKMDKLEHELEVQYDKKIDPWWHKALKTMNITTPHGAEMATLLFYISPWLNRWRGIQMPVELVSGEPGSGKSSTYELRLEVLSGRPRLRNIPTDLKDWHAGITSSGGMYVIDNVQFTNKELRQRISDEVCRIITEPQPHVEMRQLYTTSSQLTLPVHIGFAFTAIEQPFLNSDLLQRAALFDFSAFSQGGVDSSWVSHQLNRMGGREGWLAHQYIVLQRFLVLAKEEWSEDKPATHRLAHYEQAMTLMGKVLGLDTSWLVQTLTSTMAMAISESDWTMQALKEYSQEMRDAEFKGRFRAKDVIQWASSKEAYENNTMLQNAHRLGRYMNKQTRMLQTVCGIIRAGEKNNAVIWAIVG